MKKFMTMITVIAVVVILALPTAASALTQDTAPDFSGLFDGHGAVMLLIEPETGSILYANDAAAAFYGYSKEQLTSMQITQINTLAPEETAAEMQAAQTEQRNFFLFEHRLADGEIRTVEVYSYPVQVQNRQLLFSIIHDTTEKANLEQQHRELLNALLIGGIIVIAFLLLLVILLILGRRRLKAAMQRIEGLEDLRKTFLDASNSLIYLKDEAFRYVFVNRAMENFYGKTEQALIGKDDYAISDAEFADQIRLSDEAVLKEMSLIISETELEGRTFQRTKFPVRLHNGQSGVGAYITDISEERELEKKREMALYRHRILADILSHGFQNRHDQLDYVLHEALKLTESKYGYIYLYDEERREFTLNSWTSGVMDACTVAEKFTVYQLDQTGIWGEVVRQRRAIVINDFEQPNPLKKGYPEGHVELKRFLSVPVMIDEKIVAVVGLANKQSEYDDNDVYEMTLLMNGTWNDMQRRQTQEQLTYERNKYLQTLISIGDGVLVVDGEGRVEMLNHVAERLTGWAFRDALGKHYSKIFSLAHEQEGLAIGDPIAEVFETNSVQEMENYAVLVSRTGEKFFLEDSAAPIRDEAGITVGVVLVFRDVTDKKKQRTEIEYLSFHDSLTGLYNRRFFEEELRRADSGRNLPLSVIMGDVNALKLTNDIFGHTYGDLLLTKFAEVMKKVCRADDIIARWGGDEFVILLPKTGLSATEQIISRIKVEFSKERIKAIKGSVSMGADTKIALADSIWDSLIRAEERMYAAKILERVEVRSDAIKTIIRTLHESIPREKQHSEYVSDLCEEMGKALSLPKVEIGKLKRVGFFHNIGKIALDPRLLCKGGSLTDGEWDEIRKHPGIGYRILNFFDDTLDLSEIVLAHHECWDGSGYPKGLKGDEIPLLARILSIAEFYERRLHTVESLGSEYAEAALQAVRDGAGKQFDPKITEVFVQIIQSKNGQPYQAAADCGRFGRGARAGCGPSDVAEWPRGS